MEQAYQTLIGRLDRDPYMREPDNAGKSPLAPIRSKIKSASNTADNNLREALEEACSYLSASMCLLLLYNTEGEEEDNTRRLRQSYSTGMSAEQALEFERLANRKPSADYLGGLSSPVVAYMPIRNGLAPLQDWALSANISSFALAPLAVGGDKRGIIAFCAAPSRPYTDDDIRTLQLVSKMVSLAMAISYPEAKNRFMNALSHELRTPLTSIIGFTQIIRKRMNNSPDKDERLLGQIDVLWSQAQRLNKLIDTFVDVSRLESGQFSITPDRVDIVSVLKEATEQGLAQARSKHRIVYRLPDHGIEVLADARRVNQVFSQVLSNAIRFSPENKPILVRCEDLEVEGKVVVSITDKGPGIPEARVRQIFERFAASEPLRAGGLGVGLYISKSIVEAHGGNMSLESHPKKGTTIRIELPK